MNRKNPEIVKAFDAFFVRNDARDLESVSGIGSSMVETRAIRDALPALFAEFEINSMIDAPCGDLNWVRDIIPYLKAYTGIDIVDDLIARCQERYGHIPNVSFRVGDLTEEVFEPVDVIMCRDCLVHFSEEMIHAAYEKFKASGARYVLTTHYEDINDPVVGPELNKPIRVGQWRPLCLTKAPYSWPEPLTKIDEESRQRFGPGKTLALFALQ